MAKEVRLNDKWWYGKHKGHSIKEILDCDRMFLEDLVHKGKITFHKNVQDYLSGGSRYTKKSFYMPDDENDNWWQPARPNPDPHAQQDDGDVEWEQQPRVGEVGLDLTGGQPVWINGSTVSYTVSTNSSSTTYISVDSLMGNATTSSQ